MARATTNRRTHEASNGLLAKPAHVVQAETICHHFNWPEPVQIPGGTMLVCQGHITPDISQEILSHYHIDNNRTKRASKIPLYAEDMRSHAWRMGHQGIAFNSQGLLFDGQNRLHACIESGTDFDSMISFNVPESAMSVTDTGSMRSLADAARVERIEMSPVVRTAIRFAAFGGRGYSRTHTTLLACLRILGDGVEFLHSQFKSPIRRITIAPMMGLIVRAFYTSDPVRLTEFCGCLRDRSIPDKSRDSAALAMLKKLDNDVSYGGSGMIQVYWTGNHALSKFLAGDPLTKVNCVQHENFPLPEAIQAELDRLS